MRELTHTSSQLSNVSVVGWNIASDCANLPNENKTCAASSMILRGPLTVRDCHAKVQLISLTFRSDLLDAARCWFSSAVFYLLQWPTRTNPLRRDAKIPTGSMDLNAASARVAVRPSVH